MADLSDYMTAAEAVDRLAHQYQQMTVASAALRDLGRFKQIKEESEASQRAAATALALAQTKTDEAASRVIAAEMEANEKIAAAESDAKIIRNDAQMVFDEKVASAEAQAENIVTRARESADRITTNAQETLARLQAQIDEASEDIVRMNADKDTIRLEVEAAERQLQAARDAVRNLMGGA